MRQAANIRNWIVSLFLIGFSLPVSAQDDQVAENLAQVGQNAQREKDFETALDAWMELCKSYPDSKLAPKAHLYAGTCATQLKKYDLAIQYLTQAIKKLSAEEVESLASAHLHMGYSQLELGRVRMRENQKKEGEQLLATATQTLQSQLERFPKFKDNDQAAYFQGLAFEQLQQLPEAVQSYEKMLTFPQPTFRFTGLFALANVNEQLGRFEQALKYYRDYLQAAAKSESTPSDLSEVRFRTAETLWQLAMGARNRNEQPEFESLTREANELLQAALSDSGFPYRDEALFRQALIASQLGDHANAARIFGEVAQWTGSTRADQAALFAGREFLSAGNYGDAEKAFKQCVQKKNKWSLEAAHWLAQSQLQSGNPDAAYESANASLGQAAGGDWEIELLADRAEGAWQQSANQELRKRAPQLFLEVVKKDAHHALAASSLYNAAFASLELRELQTAVDLAARFAKEYPKSEFLPDALEVHADALIVLERIPEAAPLLNRLADEFKQHSKHASWQVRRALASYLAQDFPAAVQAFAKLAPELKDKQLSAEAYHWLGASHLQLKQYPPAIDAFLKSQKSSEDWRRAADTLSMLSQAQSASGDAKAAEMTLAVLKQKFPDHQSTGDAELRLAKQAFQAGDFARALTLYNRLLQSPTPEIEPHALYDSACCLAKLADQDPQNLIESETRFKRVISEFAKHALAPKALLGRSAVLRQAGRPADALEELDRFIATFSQHEQLANARFDRGLTLSSLQKWKEAIAEFQSLLEFPAAETFRDQVHYELAWCLRENSQLDAANQQFALIAEKYPTSPVASNAFFQLGERDYAAGEFKPAMDWYEKCLSAKPAADLAEKALYKLGFAQFRNKDFVQSLATFRKQVAEHPKGPLAGDGMFMVGESLFEAKQFDAALSAYRTARPVIETSNTIIKENRWLTLLHGAQSANEQKDYQAALELARDLAEDETADAGMRCDAWLEVGNAHQGLKQLEPAIEAWTKATASIDKTGARAQCMLGEALFAQKKFPEAIKQFKQVYFGFGGNAVDASIDPWQAFAAYEIARCHYVQISSAEAELKTQLLDETVRWFELIVEKFPKDQLADDARKELEKLKNLSAK